VANFIHGHFSGGHPSPEYLCWMAMKKRCYYKKAVDYQDYGGRGIKVCSRWKDSFAAFLADVGPRPSSLHTLERKNPNGDYTPLNVRWATRREQAQNRRNTVRVGTLCLSEWARRRGIPVSTAWRWRQEGRI
jgi:hypothetical protein